MKLEGLAKLKEKENGTATMEEIYEAFNTDTVSFLKKINISTKKRINIINTELERKRS